MRIYTDQIGHSCTLDIVPRRIISLVPSQTELLHDLGLTDEVVGITKFCVHPEEWFRVKTRIGGTKQVHVDQVAALQPDLIIANKEENLKEQVETLRSVAPVWVSDVNTLADALEMITSLGIIVGRQNESTRLVENIRREFASLPFIHESHRTKAAYLIWKDPFMTVGGDTFISDMMVHAGLHNVFGDQQRYPELSIEQIRNSGCRLLLLSSEPYPFKMADLAALQLSLPDVEIKLVDGEMFSWYGSRLLQAPRYFKGLFGQ